MVAAPPAAPRVATPPPFRRRQRRHGGTALLLAIAVLIALVAMITHSTRTTSGSSQSFPRPPYAPQLDRNAEWVGPTSGLSDKAIDALAHNAGIEVMTKFANGFDISAHFEDARRLAAAARAAHNPIQIYEYFSASFWFTANETEWGSYAHGFNSSWLLQDVNGDPIPFYGVGHRAGTSSPTGYLVDLSNPDFRAWAEQTIVSWMRQAPYAGIIFDSANPLLSSATRASIGPGESTNFEQLLCGTGGVTELSCDKLDEWNRGLTTLISDTRTALHQTGQQVIYNGIAPNTWRGPTRNLGLLDSADATTNESFCLTVPIRGPGQPQYQPLADDLSVMKQIADEHKKVIEITNYHTQINRVYGDYCLAGFLMGWQPGSSYYVFHAGYTDALNHGYPEVAEANLALGKPTEDYRTNGATYSRQFANGYVAVNTGAKPSTVKVPFAGQRFGDGGPKGALKAGQSVQLGAHDTLYLLSNSYLYG